MSWPVAYTPLRTGRKRCRETPLGRYPAADSTTKAHRRIAPAAPIGDRISAPMPTPANGDGTLIGPVEAGHQAQHRGLSGTVEAQEGGDRAGREGNGYVVHGTVGAEGSCHPHHLDHWKLQGIGRPNVAMPLQSDLLANFHRPSIRRHSASI